MVGSQSSTIERRRHTHTQYQNECAGLAGDLKATKATKAGTNEALFAS